MIVQTGSIFLHLHVSFISALFSNTQLVPSGMREMSFITATVTATMFSY